MTTIKGLLFNIHINRLREIKGPEAIKKLQERYGKPLLFNAFQDYYTEDEERLIKECVRIIYNDNVPGDEDFEAGKFHMESFLETEVGKNTINLARKNPKYFLKLSSNVINKVISKGFDIEFIDKGPNKALIICKNSGYSMRHLEGIWKTAITSIMENAQILSEKNNDQEYQFLIEWSDQVTNPNQQ